MSAITPQRHEPTTVPASAANGSHDTNPALTWYSVRIPGVTKPRLAGFMMSMTRASARRPATRQCAAVSGAFSSGAITSIGRDCCSGADFGSSPKAASPAPTTMAAMPSNMPGSMGMPARM